jgi:prophage regulatory protein
MATICSTRIMRANEVMRRLGASRTTIWRWEREGKMPRKRRVGPNIVGWREDEIEEWWASQNPEDGDEPGTAPAEAESEADPSTDSDGGKAGR